MTNSEKANEIASNAKEGRYFDVYQSAHIMANWKDKQFKKYLEKKRNEVNQCKQNSLGLFPYDVIMYNGAIEVIDEIINELFSKTEQDNSDMEE